MNLDELLSETATVAEPAPHVLESGRRALGSAMSDPVDAVASSQAAQRPRRPQRRRRLVLVAAAVAAASVVVLGPVTDLGGGPGASAAASQVLLRAGAAAGAQPGGWPDAAYWHSISEHRRGADDPVQRREIWLGHRTPGALVDPVVAGGAAGAVVPLGVAGFPAGAARLLSWDDLYALPTDPAQLERNLRAGIDGAGPDDDTELFVIVGDLLRESPAPPALRKALWEVAARVPGVELVGSVTDGAGRIGVAVERDTQRYVLDPTDGRLLEESNGGWRATYLEQGPAEGVQR